MGWFKFLIYFSLFAGAILNLITAINLFTGSHYGGAAEAELVYLFFPDMQTLDICMALGLIAFSCFSLITRFRLSGYHKDALLFLNCTYAAAAVLSLFYVIFAGSIVSFELVSDTLTEMVTSVIVSLVMIIVNTVYFTKRKHLFVK